MKRKLKWWVKPLVVVVTAIFIGLIVIFCVGISRIVQNLFSSDEEVEVTSQNESASEDVIKDDAPKETSQELSSKVTEPEAVYEESIVGYVNTFGGYTSLFAANGGNETSDDSNFAKQGLNVSIYIEDDDDKIIEAFVNGEIDFFAMTVNKMALVAKQLEDKGIETIMPCFLDTSTGGDGIVTDSNVKTITDLKDVKISMAKNSVSTAIPVWFLNESGLDEEEVQQIVDNFVLFDSTQEAVNAFISGEVQAVSTWDMTTALSKEDSHLLFSTASAEYLVIDGLVFNKEFAESHKDEVLAMIDGIFTTVNDINNDVNKYSYYESIRTAVPDYNDYSYDEIEDEISYAKFLGYSGNADALEVADYLYKDFCKVWQQLGFETDEDYSLITDSYIKSLESKWSGVEDSKNQVAVSTDIDEEALISQHVMILFNGDRADFKTGYEEEDMRLIDEFVKNAKILNKTIIQITGHVNLGTGSSVWDEETGSYKKADGVESSEFAYKLSMMRAETVKEYMVSQGISEDRIIIEGVGGDYPIDTNDTPEGQANNRSCEIGYYQAGGY